MSEDRSALIIANCIYADPELGQLSAPAEDAAALGTLLAAPAFGGFVVKTLFDETTDAITAVIEDFLADRRHDDLILLYYSGHGLKDEEGNLYFAGRNTRLVNHQLRRSTAVDSSFVNDAMRRCRSRRQVFLLDCCYSGAFPRDIAIKGATTVDSETRFQGNGRIVLTASDVMQAAFEERRQDEGAPARSHFTRILVDGIKTGEADRDQDGFVSLDELYDYVYGELRKTPPYQRPLMIGMMEGKLLLTRNPSLKPPSLPAELVRASASEWVPTRLAAVKELARLFTGSHRGLAEAARTALSGLLEDDSRQVAMAAALALESETSAGSRDALPTAPPREAKPTPVDAATPTPPPTEPLHRAADQPVLSAIEAQPSTPSGSHIGDSAANAAQRMPQARAIEPPGAQKWPWEKKNRSMLLMLVIVGVLLMLVVVLPQLLKKKEEPIEETTPATTAAPEPVTTGDNLTTADPAGSPLAEGRSWPVAFSGDFSSMESVSKAWSLEEGDKDHSTSVVTPGSLRLTNSADAKTTLGAYAIEVTGDFYATVDMKAVEISSTGCGSLQFQIDSLEGPNGNRYDVTLRPSHYQRWLRAKGQWERLLETSPPTLHPLDQSNTLAVVVKGPHVFVFLNGEEVDRFDSNLGSGWVGLNAEKATFDFAKFEVRTPTGKTGR